MTTVVVVLATCLFAWCAVLVLIRRAVRAAHRAGVRLSDRARSSVLAHGTGPRPRPHGCAVTWTGPSPAPAAR